MRELIADKVGNKVDLLADYGVKKQNEVDFSSPFALLQMLSQKPSEPEGPAVALVYVDGMIDLPIASSKTDKPGILLIKSFLPPRAAKIFHRIRKIITPSTI